MPLSDDPVRTQVNDSLPSILTLLQRIEVHLATMVRLLETGYPRSPQDLVATQNLRNDLVFDAGRSEIQRVGQGQPRVAQLTAQERALLLYLLGAPRRWFAIDELSDHLIALGLLSSEARAPDRSVMGIVSQLRSKLGDYDHTLIRLNRRIGYGIFPGTATP